MYPYIANATFPMEWDITTYFSSKFLNWHRFLILMPIHQYFPRHTIYWESLAVRMFGKFTLFKHLAEKILPNE